MRSLAWFVVLCAACSPPPMESFRTEVPIQVDGDSRDWPIDRTVYLEENRAVLGLAHDDSTLYLMVRFRNEPLARKALVGGVSVWWATSGLKAKEVGVVFPPVRSLQEALPEPGMAPWDSIPRGEARPQARRGGPPRLRWHEPEEGILHPGAHLVTARNLQGLEGTGTPVRFASRFSVGTYTYELAIPRTGHLGVGTGSLVHVFVGVGTELSAQDRELAKRRALWPSPPARREEPGAGPPGERPGRSWRPDPLGDLLEPLELWCAIRLSGPPLG